MSRVLIQSIEKACDRRCFEGVPALGTVSVPAIDYDSLWHLLLDCKAALASREGEVVAWDKFPAYLIDHCEGDVISELGLQHALSNMLRDPQYSTTKPAHPQAAVPECNWIYDDEEDSWDADCGARWQFITDGPDENNVKFCHKCGGKVARKERTE